MSIAPYAQQLAGEIRQSTDPHAPAVRLGLQLAIAAWLHAAHQGACAQQWGLFGTTVQDVLTALYPGPSPITVQIDQEALADDEANRAAVSEVVTAIADLLTSRHSGSYGWEAAAAAAQLRHAVQDLQ